MESVLNEEDKATLAYVRLLLALPFVAVFGSPASARTGRAVSGLILRLGTGLGLVAGGAGFLGDGGPFPTAAAGMVWNGNKKELVTGAVTGDGMTFFSLVCQDKHAPDSSGRPLVRTSTTPVKNITPDTCFR